MTIRGRVLQNIYRDSIALMRAAQALASRPGVQRAEVLLGTAANLAALQHRELWVPELARASLNDIVVVIEADSPEAAEQAIAESIAQLMTASLTASSEREVVYSLQSALAARPDANLALLSIPGQFVKREALRALKAGLHLMIFSDNVPLEDECEIKRMADSADLLVMGPDCGTAILNGVGLGFANHVRSGDVGIVGASGTGLQELTCLLHRAGLGIRHAIGTGSNDIKERIGGLTLLKGFQLLEADPGTAVIVIISKPPEEAVVQKILPLIRHSQKPIVVDFIGGEMDALCGAYVSSAKTIHHVAKLTAELAGSNFSLRSLDWERVPQEYSLLQSGQQYIRGVFSGGTFAAEAALILSAELQDVYTNIKLSQVKDLQDPSTSIAHTCVDMGDDVFTRGKPHPMLEPSLRRERILQEARDPSTAALLLDLVLGYGVHPDPARFMADIVVEARNLATEEGRYLPVVASVCGTEEDPQRRSKQVGQLKSAGALVFESNAEAAGAALAIVQRSSERGRVYE